MSTLGIKECSQHHSKASLKEETFWVAVKVERGFATEAVLFRTEKLARIQEMEWRKGMNIDYDESDVFKVSVQDTIIA